MGISEQLKQQRFQFQNTVAEGTYSYTIRVDNLYQTNDFFVESIDTPQGPFIENIPLPESIVRDMVLSIESILGENIPTISLDNVSLIFEATETGDNPASQDVVISNTGSFGSLLSVGLVSDQSWATISPDILGNIAKDEGETTTIQAVVGDLAAGTYTASIDVVDDRASNTPQTIGISFTILPQPTIGVVPNMDMTFNAVEGINPPIQVLSISNVGPSTSELNWIASVVGTSAWLTLNPSSGGPLLSTDSPNAMSVIVDVTNMVVGTYVDVIRISDLVATNDFIEIQVQLTITA